jgi:hypothetical protein
VLNSGVMNIPKNHESVDKRHFLRLVVLVSRASKV